MREELTNLKKLRAAVRKQQTAFSRIHKEMYEEALEDALRDALDEIELRIEETQDDILIAMEGLDE